jgi:hypothetical protein
MGVTCTVPQEQLSVSSFATSVLWPVHCYLPSFKPKPSVSLPQQVLSTDQHMLWHLNSLHPRAHQVQQVTHHRRSHLYHL